MQDIKQQRRWLAFKVTPNGDGTFKKLPVSVLTGGLSSCSDPSTWASWAEAKAVCAAQSDLVLGFALGKEVGMVIVDFDKVRKTTSDPWPEWVLEEVERINSFTEVSASGLGLHVLAWGSIPENFNRQKLHVEVWDCDKMFALTGQVFQGRDKIYARDLTELHARIKAGKIGPNYKSPFVVYAYDTPKYKDIINDQWRAYFGSRSDAVQSALWTLARKHDYDPEAMRSEFEGTSLCAAWGDKWERRSEAEIAHAIEEVKKRIAEGKLETAPGVQRLQFSKDPVDGQRKDFVMRPTGEYDGWFPRSGVSLVAGSSGAGKTTLMLDLLDRQARGASHLGHQGAGFKFLSLFFDRGKFQNEETLERMGLLDKGLDIEYLADSWDFGAAANILSAIEQWGVPPVVFVEGADMLVSDANKVEKVSPFMGWMKDIAEHYHIAVILSVGAPKSKPNEQHTLTRDRVFGSQIWARRAATVAYMVHVGDGSAGQRDLILEHRNAITEKFQLEFNNGLLVPRVVGAENTDEFGMWAREQTSGFTFDESLAPMKTRGCLMTKTELKAHIKGLVREGFLEKKLVKGKATLFWKQDSQA